MSTKRRSNLPKSLLQLKIVFVFLGLGITCLVAQYTFSLYAIHDLVAMFPDVDPRFPSMLTKLLLQQLVTAGALMVPLMISLGILMTFRFAGPLYRIESYLKSVARGEDPGPLTLRVGDELQEVADAVNEALEHVRSTQEAPAVTVDS